MNNKHCVLIVDNNPEDLMPLICFMEDKFNPVVVPEQSSCMQFAEDTCPDIILVDDMVSDPNCYDTCQGLKSLQSIGDVPIILMSDLTADELGDEVDYLGADDFICKPIKKNELIEKIDTLISFSGTSIKL
ncbi:MAG: response regulator [Spongiibacteraceae bacterium]|nr:response regulator [Spongiibacteraceae bacterium]